MNRVNHEEVKEELLKGIPELSPSSRKAINLVMGVQCDAGRTIIRTIIGSEVRKVITKIGEVKEAMEGIDRNQQDMAKEIKEIKGVVGVNGD